MSRVICALLFFGGYAFVVWLATVVAHKARVK